MSGDKGVDKSRRAFLKLASIASAALALSATSIADAQSPVPYKAWKTRWSLGEIEADLLPALKGGGSPAL